MSLPAVPPGRARARRGNCRLFDTGRRNLARDRLFAGGNRNRTISPAEKETAPRPTIVVSRDDLCLMTPSQLIGPASLVGNSERPFTRAGPMVRVRLPPAVSLNPGCMPLFVALIATAFFGERLSAARKLGLGLILGGSVMLVGWHAAGWSAARSLSDALFVGASLLTAGFTVPMPRAKLDPLHAAALVSTGSLALYGPLYLAFCGARLARLPPISRFTRSSRACS